MFVILHVTDSCSAMHLLKTGFQAHDNWKKKKKKEQTEKLLCIFEGKNVCGKMAKNNCQENGPNQPLQSENIWGILHKTIFPLPLPRVGAGAEGFVWEGVTHGSLGKTRRSRPLPCRRVGCRGQALCRWWNRIHEAMPGSSAHPCQAWMAPAHSGRLRCATRSWREPRLP